MSNSPREQRPANRKRLFVALERDFAHRWRDNGLASIAADELGGLRRATAFERENAFACERHVPHSILADMFQVSRTPSAYDVIVVGLAERLLRDEAAWVPANDRSAFCRSMRVVKHAIDWLPIALCVAFLLSLASLQRDRALRGENDFVQLYTGAKLAGGPDLYSRPANLAAVKATLGFTMETVVYTRPPFYAALLKPLSFLPYRAAYAVFSLFSLVTVVWFVVTFRKECPSLPLFASMSVPAISALCGGQDTPLLLAILERLGSVDAAESRWCCGTCAVARCDQVPPLFIPARLARREEALDDVARNCIRDGGVDRPGRAGLWSGFTPAVPGMSCAIRGSIRVRSRRRICMDLPQFSEADGTFELVLIAAVVAAFGWTLRARP